MENGADPAISEDMGYTSLHIATLRGHLNVLNHLIKNNLVDIHIPNNNGHTALSIAAEYGHDEIVLMLMKSGANPHIIDCLGILKFTANFVGNNRFIRLYGF